MTKLTKAAKIKIRTRTSSNYSLIFSQIDSFSFFYNSFKPNFYILLYTSYSDKPFSLLDFNTVTHSYADNL